MDTLQLVDPSLKTRFRLGTERTRDILECVDGESL